MKSLFRRNIGQVAILTTTSLHFIRACIRNGCRYSHATCGKFVTQMKQVQSQTKMYKIRCKYLTFRLSNNKLTKHLHYRSLSNTISLPSMDWIRGQNKSTYFFRLFCGDCRSTSLKLCLTTALHRRIYNSKGSEKRHHFTSNKQASLLFTKRA